MGHSSTYGLRSGKLKRSILLSLFAALALAVGFSSVAIAAGDGTAQASKKGKGCKKKGKGKAGKSTATAQAKKKGKGCKKKAPPKATPEPEELGEGRYADAANGVELNLFSSGKSFFASVKISIPGSCATFTYESAKPSPANMSPSGGVEVRESGTISVAGEPFDVTLKLTVANTLEYTLAAEVKAKDPALSCGYSGAITGNLSKG